MAQVGFSLLFFGRYIRQRFEVPYDYICNDDFNFLGHLVKGPRREKMG